MRNGGRIAFAIYGDENGRMGRTESRR